MCQGKGCRMRKQYTLVVLSGISFMIYGASGVEPEKVVEEKFEEAKLAIATGRPGALGHLSEKMIRDHQEKVKQLLEYALRSTHENSKEYVDQLINILKTGSQRSSESLPLMDIAIMQGNVEKVKKFLELKPDLSASRLISETQTVSTTDALNILIQRMQKNETVSDGQEIKASLAELQDIKKLIDEYNAKKSRFSFKNPFKKKK